MKKRIVLSTVFLISGIFIYYLFCSKMIEKNNVAFLYIRNYIPDMCWTVGFYLVSINFTKNIVKSDLVINSLYVFVVALIFELLQLTGIVRGTFDIIDISIYIISIIFASLIEKKIRRKENEKNT